MPNNTVNERNHKVNIAKNIRKYRTLNTISQTDLAAIIGVKQSTISRWENGADLPVNNHINALLVVFNCSYEELLSVEPDQKPDEQSLLNSYRKLAAEDKKKLLSIAELLSKN